MKGSDRMILVALPLLALVIGFYVLVIGPKRSDSAGLQDQVDTLQASISLAESEIAAGEAARGDFPKAYGRLVTLGRAAPADGGQATFVFDMSGLGKRNDVEFRNFELTGSGEGEEAPPPPPDETPAEAAEARAVPAGEEPVTNAVPTEATAAALPLGSTVGDDGLLVQPYTFRYLGNFFHMASFFTDMDDTVKVTSKGPNVSGRLVTVDGFSITGDPFTGFPTVQADFAVTTYIVPDELGVAAGATPGGPAPVGSPEAPTTVSSEG
jgi:hypothetical protein